MRIAIVGTGNLSYALMNAFLEIEDVKLYLYGRNRNKVLYLEKYYGITPVTKQDLGKPYDLIILAITDTAIEDFSNSIAVHPSSIISHTSGATSINVLSNHKKFAIFYPLYSFPKKRKVNFDKVPILLDYSSFGLKESMEKIATQLSKKIYQANDQMRLQYHLSAVFANNFTNHLLTKAYDLLEDEGLEKNVLLPIIKQSCRNWTKGLAKTTQTGPAQRNDTRTLTKHRDLLENCSKDLELYDLLSKSIYDYYVKN